MKNKLYDGLLVTLFLALTINSGFVYAEKAVTNSSTKQKEPLVITLTANKVQKSANGKELFSSATKIKPGEMVEYKAKYANVSKASLRSVVATLPVPKGMEYIHNTANPVAVTASTDNMQYGSIPLKQKVKDKTGKEVEMLVPISEYRSLRWSLGDIEAGKAVTVSARVRVAK